MKEIYGLAAPRAVGLWDRRILALAGKAAVVIALAAGIAACSGGEGGKSPVAGTNEGPGASSIEGPGGSTGSTEGPGGSTVGTTGTVAGAVEITVDPAKTYQTMSGWEVTARLWETNKRINGFDPSWEKYAGELFPRLVNELGINRVRIEIKSGVENSADFWAQFRDGTISYTEYKTHYYDKANDNADSGQINPAGFQFSILDYQLEKIVLPMAKLLAANGEKLYVNLNFVDFKSASDGSGFSHAQSPAEYAELIVAAFEHVKLRHGITIDALELVLEPENTTFWRGQQMGAALVAAANRLATAGFHPDFIGPSTTALRAAPGYFDAMITVPGVTGLLSEISYHRYDGGKAGTAYLPQILSRAQKYGLKTSMLEHLGGDAEELYADLTIGNASAWQQYGIATELGLTAADAGSYYYLVDPSQPSNSGIRMASRTPPLAQYFRFIRSGAVRVGALSNSADHLPVAFRNKDGGDVVVLQSKRAAAFSIRGLAAGAYGIRYTAGAEIGKELPPVEIAAGQPLPAAIPAAGVITIYRSKAR